jgi:hypothetical protein
VTAILGMIVGGLMLSTIASNIIVLFDEAHMHEKVQKQKMLQVEQWAKDLRLSKPTRVRLLTFYRRQVTQCSLKWTECSREWAECSLKWIECSLKCAV